MTNNRRIYETEISTKCNNWRYIKAFYNLLFAVFEIFMLKVKVEVLRFILMNVGLPCHVYSRDLFPSLPPKIWNYIRDFIQQKLARGKNTEEKRVMLRS